MKNRRTLAITSTAVLAAGMAEGAVVYTDAYMWKIPGDSAEYPIDLDGDSVNDCNVRFDNNNQNKPFIDARVGQSGVESPNAWTFSNNESSANLEYWGAPVTPFGTSIDSAYAETCTLRKTAYLYQDYDGAVLGDWPLDQQTDAYVGVALVNGSATNFGYVHLIFDPQASPRIMTLVGYAYESTPGEGIVAGARVTPAEPLIYTDPVAMTVGGGEPVQLEVQALANPAPAYQWQAGPVGSGVFTNLMNNGHFLGVDTAILIIDSATLADNLDYRVVVSNNLGTATSTPATLKVVATVLGGPDPSDARIFAGQDAQFEISVLSGIPTAYQWRKGGVNLIDGAKYSGTTTGSLIISNLTEADNGVYDVVVTSPSGSATSSGATLTAISANGGAFESETLAKMPSTYYRLNETEDPVNANVVAYDNVGGKNGLYGTAVQNGNVFYNIAGPRPSEGFSGFQSGNSAIKTIKGDTNGIVTLAPWNLNTNVVTITAWIKPMSEPADGTGIVYTRDPNSTMVCGMQFHSGFAAPPPYALGYNWNDNTWAWNSKIIVPTNKWSLVSLVVTPTNAIIRMMCDDKLTAATNTATHAVQSWDRPVLIGNDPVNPDGGLVFDGMIDEVAVFKCALTEGEFTQMYANSRGIPGFPAAFTQTPVSVEVFNGQTARFFAAASGTGPLTWQWKHAGTNVVDGAGISGATTSILTIGDVSASHEGSYTLTVANPYGSATSDPVSLTIHTPQDVYEQQVLELAGGNALAAYYPLNETQDPMTRPAAYDLLGLFTGIYGTNVQNAFTGTAGPRPSDGFLGFSADNAAAGFSPADDSQINLPGFNLNANAVTMTAWIKPAANQAQYTGVVFCRGSGTSAGLAYTQVNDSAETCLGYQWNAAYDTYTWMSGLVPPLNMWSFVALVLDPSAGVNSTATIYVMNQNGISSASRTTPENLVLQSFSAPMLIGRDANEGTAECFNGSIDNVAIYAGVLTPAQIQGLYDTALTGIPPATEVRIDIQQVGSQIQLSWPNGVLLEAPTLDGPWSTNTAVSPYLFTPDGLQQFYRIRVQ